MQLILKDSNPRFLLNLLNSKTSCMYARLNAAKNSVEIILSSQDHEKKDFSQIGNI